MNILHVSAPLTNQICEIKYLPHQFSPSFNGDWSIVATNNSQDDTSVDRLDSSRWIIHRFLCLINFSNKQKNYSQSSATIFILISIFTHTESFLSHFTYSSVWGSTCANLYFLVAAHESILLCRSGSKNINIAKFLLNWHFNYSKSEISGYQLFVRFVSIY